MNSKGKVVSNTGCKANKNVLPMRGNTFFLLLFAFFVFAGETAFAQMEIVFQQGLGGYSGTHDTYFQTGDPLAIHGTEDFFEWDGEDAGGFNFGMLRFDDIFGTAAGQVSPTAVVQQAFLTLTVIDEGDATQTGNFYDLLMPFDDTLDFFEFGDGLGFDPRPGIDYSETPLADIPGPADGDILELDVTSSIQAIQSGSSNYGWVFIPGGSNGVGIASSEAATLSTRPKLTIVVEGEAQAKAARSLSQNWFRSNETITVSLAVSLASGTRTTTIEETLPAGWTASSISNGGSFASGKVSWSLVNFTGSATLTYSAKAPASPSGNAQFSGTIDGSGSVTGTFTVQYFSADQVPPLYKMNNVLAVGIWNDSSGSSDLVGTAELSDNNNVVYVRDSGATEGWPPSTSFRWLTVLYGDGFGEEQPGWQQRDFDDSGWNIEDGIGFTIGQGGGNENGEIPLDPAEDTIYTRSVFDAVNYESIRSFTLKLEGDDSAIAWLNGVYVALDGASTGDAGEVAPDFAFNTYTAGRSGDVSGEAATDYDPGTIVSFPVNLVESTSTPVSDWSIY